MSFMIQYDQLPYSYDLFPAILIFSNCMKHCNLSGQELVAMSPSHSWLFVKMSETCVATVDFPNVSAIPKFWQRECDWFVTLRGIPNTCGKCENNCWIDFLLLTTLSYCSSSSLEMRFVMFCRKQSVSYFISIYLFRWISVPWHSCYNSGTLYYWQFLECDIFCLFARFWNCS